MPWEIMWRYFEGIETYYDAKDINIALIDKLLQQSNFCINRTIVLNDTSQWTTFLGAAVWKGDYELIDYLISKHATINDGYPSKGGSVMNLAIEKGNVELVKYLQNRGLNINEKYEYGISTPIVQAALDDNYDIVKYFIEEGLDVNGSDNDGYRPLHFAAGSKNEKMVELLLDNNAEIEVVDRFSRTPLRLAMERGRINNIKLLLSRGADINRIQNDERLTPILHKIIWPEILGAPRDELMVPPYMKYLLTFDELATDINNLDRNGSTVLHRKLSRAEVSQICNLILDAGVDVNVKNSDGKLAVNSIEGDPTEIILVKRHIVKLISAELTVCEENRQAVEEGFEDLKSECRKEIERMKINRIGMRNITMFDVLAFNVHYSAVRLKFVDLNQVIDEEKLHSEYPLYGGMLFFKLSTINRRIKYLEDIEQHMEETLWSLTLPLTFIRELWYYFTNIELKKLVYSKFIKINHLIT